MAPKKDSKTTKNATQKAPRGRGRAVKTKAESPTRSETIPLIKLCRQYSGVRKTPMKRTKKQLDPLEKIALANEVARAQLVKDMPIVEPDPSPTPVCNSKMKVGRKKGQQQVITSTFFDNKVKQKPVKRRVSKKLSVDSDYHEVAPKKPIVSKKPIVDSTQNTNTQKAPRPRRVTRSKSKLNETIPDDSHNSKTIGVDGIKNVKGEPDHLQCGNERGSADPTLEITVKVPKKAASNVNSRKTSMNSTSSNSWTKDISSSSTTTCLTVSTNDIVRIDKKLPVVQLNCLDREVNKFIAKGDDDSSSDSDSSSCSTNDYSDVFGVKSKSLNLSESSCTIKTNIASPKHDAIVDDLSKALDKLSSKLKNYDMEIINWIGYDNNNSEDSAMQEFQNKMFNILKEENQVMKYCRHLKEILSDDSGITAQVDSPSKDCDINDIVIPPSIYCREVSDDFEECDKFTSEDSKHAMLSQNVVSTPILKDVNEKFDNSDTFTPERVDYTRFDKYDDDDDALSLFTESIPDESYRYNDSIVSVANMGAVSEEYIPQPLHKPCSMPKKFTYYPTKIHENIESPVKKAICEKQNADSTSINKESEYSDNISKANNENAESDVRESHEINNYLEDGPTETGWVYPNGGNGLIASMFRPLQGIKSYLFRGYCFFNMVKSCKNQSCNFPHVMPDPLEIQNRLMKLREDLFIKEYMLMRNWPVLRRAYGLLFVNECRRRELTRILVEMAIDFTVKANPGFPVDGTLRTAVLEMTLMDLNEVELSGVGHLLNYGVGPLARLCDALMQAIASTQNFSRFKRVFCKLTTFIADQGRMFNPVVVEQILERMCILPHDQELLRAVATIIGNTDRAIFQSDVMAQFEMHVQNLDEEYSAELQNLKKDMCEEQTLSRGAGAVGGAEVGVGAGGGGAPLLGNRGKRYTSPDTTDGDSLIKQPVPPMITRTVHQIPPNHGFNCRNPMIRPMEEWPKPMLPFMRCRFPRPPLPALALPPHPSLPPRAPHPPQPLFPPPLRYHKRPASYDAPPAKFPRRQLQHY